MKMPPTRPRACAEPWGASAGRKKDIVYRRTATLHENVENRWHTEKYSSAESRRGHPKQIRPTGTGARGHNELRRVVHTNTQQSLSDSPIPCAVQRRISPRYHTASPMRLTLGNPTKLRVEFCSSRHCSQLNVSAHFPPHGVDAIILILM